MRFKIQLIHVDKAKSTVFVTKSQAGPNNDFVPRISVSNVFNVATEAGSKYLNKNTVDVSSN